jgi:hypothetical protein
LSGIFDLSGRTTQVHRRPGRKEEVCSVPSPRTSQRHLSGPQNGSAKDSGRTAKQRKKRDLNEREFRDELIGFSSMIITYKGGIDCLKNSQKVIPGEH